MLGDSDSDSDSDSDNDHATSFGDRRVGEDEKAGLVRGVFESVAPSYDLMNDLMSAGVHRLWKRRMVAALRAQPGQHVVDVAGGTGDIAFRLIERGCRVSLVDINPAMLSVGRDRAIDRGLIGDLAWVCGDAEALPFADGTADAYTIAFGIRNVTHIERALHEARRVLKPGGRFACLEFSHVVLPALDRLYGIYADAILPRLGGLVAGDEPSYRYLVESIRRFPKQQDFAAMIGAAGLAHVRIDNLTGGVAALHTAWRL
jgi:demethylmenaquinone methyltransferase/2-methoxy-6-polyprenyl-1,4-benzoquinol methylase